MWNNRSRETAEQIFTAWYSWAIRSRLEPLKRVARMLRRHLQGLFRNRSGLGVV
jgi:transposase